MKKPIIYQIIPRLFANFNETRKHNGSKEENGCGKLVDINEHNNTLLEKMRPIVSATELKKILANAKDRHDEWIQNDFQRTEYFRETLKSGNRADIIEIIRMLSRRQKELLLRGKHLHVADERTRRDAQTPICSEIAFVKKITPDQALELILAD
ncbi:MAG: hypothetical protein II286_04175, partial [Clostridia bacterium]|nr:hypothetical protein [Clostridia bacterium]